MTIEEFSKSRKIILEEYLNRTIGTYQNKPDYYRKVFEVMATGFYSGLLSPDDVWCIAEITWMHSQSTQDAFEDIPSAFSLYIDLEWYLRNDISRAAALLEDLKKYLPNN